MKKIICISVIVIVAAIGGIYKVKASTWYKGVVANTYVSATSTAPTRLEQTQALVDSLQEQRMADPTFINETNKEIEDLKKQRITQARIDALMIVKTQLDVEIAHLDKETSKN